MRSTSRIALLVVVGICASCVPSCQSGRSAVRTYEIVGRLTFVDAQGCTSPVDSQTVSWAACHAFKERLDPASGNDYRADQPLAGALRPLPATVFLSLWTRAPGQSEFELCRVSKIFQTHDWGGFRTFIETTESCGPVGSEIRVKGIVSLAYTFDGPDPKQGTVMAFWKRDEAQALLEQNTDQSAQPPAALDRGNDYVTPTFEFTLDVADPHDGTSGDRPQRVDLGRQVFAGTASTDAFDYIKQVLSAWATTLKLHRELRELVGDDAYFDHSFGEVEVGGDKIPNAYGIHFDQGWAYGWGTGMALYRPDADKFLADGDAWEAARLLSSTDVLAHEFGHSIHGAFAGGSMAHDYNFASLMQRSSIGGPPGCVGDPGAEGPKCRDGRVYSWGHGTNQYQEMGVSFVEGIASSLGQYLLNRCGSWDQSKRPVGGGDPFALNMWLRNPACDDDDGCSYHHIRYHLKHVRGLADDSAEFNERAAGLLWLSYQGALAGHRFVTANNEGRWAELGCDLLDDDSTVSQAEGIANVTHRAYIRNYTEKVDQILNGEDPLAMTGVIKWYPKGPVPRDYVTLTLPQLLDAMANFCPAATCSNLPQSPTHSSYPAIRLSTSHVAAGVSPQKLLNYLVDPPVSLITQSDVSALLRSNFMDDVALGEPD